MKISLDTNILIDDPAIVFDKSRDFALSFTVIRELDKLKRNPDLKRAAQAAIVNIWSLFKDDQIEVLNIPTLLGESPDERIVQDAKDAGIPLLSNDIGARIIAKAHGVAISDFAATATIDYDYTGIVTVKGTVHYEQEFVQIKKMQLEEFNEQFDTDLKENMYCIIDRVVEKNDIWINQRGTVKRISQSMKPFSDAGVSLHPKDYEQMCAIHAVFDPTVPLTVIDGRLGTGKTILTLAAVLGCVRGQKRYQHYEEVYVSKPPVSINKALYTGYKPGTSEDKMSGHLGGIKSNLKFLLDKRGDSKKVNSAGEKVETISQEVWYEFFRVMEIDEAQGTSLHDSVWIVDEWQLLDEETSKLVLSRIATGSKIILVGDAQGQTYGVNRANEGFKVLYEHFGAAPEFSFIKLDKIYRSPLANFIAEVYGDD